MLPRGSKATVALDILLLCLLTGFLIRPLFRMKYMDNWASIESTFISDARFLADHWPNPQWYPHWYTGTRTDYVYPPALRYGTAVLTRYYPRMTAAKAYHIYIAFFYCVGVAGVYFFIRALTDSRLLGWLGAIMAGFCSPSYLFLMRPVSDIVLDNPMLAPQRFNALVRYGEGPHVTSLAWIPIALAASWFALRRFTPGAVIAASVSAMLVVANNFYGASAFGLIFPLLVWAIWITHQDHRIFLRAAAIGGLAYALTAFWLTPAYLTITLRNMRYVSNPGNQWSLWVLTAVVIAYLVLTDRWARGRPARAWPVFVIGFALVFFINVMGNLLLEFRVLGEPTRWIPELDLALIFVVLLIASTLWKTRAKALGWLLVAVTLAPGAYFITKIRHFIPMESNHRDRFEYQITTWIRDHLPGERLYVTGSLRFWYDGWYDLAHVGGGSEQGQLNDIVMPAQWEINLAEDLVLTHLWLDATGADAVIVHGPNSPEPYKDFVHPRKFTGKYPVLFDDGKDNLIYRVPRPTRGLAHLVDGERARAIPRANRAVTDGEPIRAYGKLLAERPAKQLDLRWQGTDAFAVRGLRQRTAGQALLVQVAFDAGWRAFAGGQPLAVREDPFGMMQVDGWPEGVDEIRFELKLPRQNQAGRAVTAAAVLALGLYAWRWRRREPLL